MRFLMRGLWGLTLIVLMLSFGGFGAYRLYEAVTADKTSRQRTTQERTYSVNTAVLTAETITPITTAYGTIESWRTLQLRASSEGKLVEVAGKFRDGAAVAKGELLLRIDPANAEFQFLDAEAALADAEAQKTEAEEAIVGAEQELEAARRQLTLRKQALERQLQLRAKGYSTAVQVETEELAVASLEQALSNRLQSVITARKRVERMDLSVQRATLALDDAQRILEETTLTAPFDGYLSDVDANLGRRVNPSETLAHLIDPSALEVRFPVSTREFSRLLDENGALITAPVTVTLQLSNRSITLPGHIDRGAAVVAEGETGRTLFATLDIGPGTVLRPGDFVKIEVQEPKLENVAVVPASAITEDGRILIVKNDQRLQEITTGILRRMGDEVVLANVPFGESYVRERLPQLGAGLKVQPRENAPQETDRQQPLALQNTSASGDLIALEPEQREALIKQLTDSDIPEQRKAKLLALLNKPMVPKDLIKRLEQRRERRG